MNDIIERRAKFVYEAARLAAQAAQAPIIPESWDTREVPFKEQFRKCIERLRKCIERQCDEQRCSSLQELHGSWVQSYHDMDWEYGGVRDVEKKTHPDLVMYDELEQLERDKDVVFVALCEIARQWIYSTEKESAES